MTRFNWLIFSLLLLSCSKNELVTDQGPRFHFVPERTITSNLTALIKTDDSFRLIYPEDQITGSGWKTAQSSDLMEWKITSSFLENCKEAPINNPKRLVSATLIHDSKNNSGLCKESNCLVFLQAAWPCSSDPESTFQPLLFSADKGTTWVKSPGVVRTDIEIGRVRDPGVFFYEPSGKWILMAPTDQRIHFFESTDLKNWKHLSMFGPKGNTDLQWEDPELIRLPIQNEPGAYRWLLSVISGHSIGKGFSAVQYFIGDFNGKSFEADSSSRPTNYLDYGRDLAGALRIQSDTEDQNKPTVLSGKIGNRLYGDDIPDKRLNGMLAFPRKLSLQRKGSELVLNQVPAIPLASNGIREIKKVEELSGVLHGTIHITLSTAGDQPRGIHLLKTAEQWISVGYNPSTNEVYIDRTHSGFVGFHPDFSGTDRYTLRERSNSIALTLVLDRNLLEVFIQDGEAVLTALIFPKDLYGKAELFGSNLPITLSGSVFN